MPTYNALVWIIWIILECSERSGVIYRIGIRWEQIDLVKPPTIREVHRLPTHIRIHILPARHPDRVAAEPASRARTVRPVLGQVQPRDGALQHAGVAEVGLLPGFAAGHAVGGVVGAAEQVAGGIHHADHRTDLVAQIVAVGGFAHAGLRVVVVLLALREVVGQNLAVDVARAAQFIAAPEVAGFDVVAAGIALADHKAPTQAVVVEAGHRARA